MTKPRKKTSKRKTGRDKAKVKKHVAEHNRKSKKQAKKDVTWKSRVKKDIGIPNSFPYKAQMLSELEAAKGLKVAARLQNVVEKNGNPDNSDIMTDGSEEWEGLPSDDENEIYEVEDVELSIKPGASKRSHDAAFKEVIKLSDVLLFVLDARDIEGTRSREIEEKIVKEHDGKDLIFVLNKIDLLPQASLDNWISYLQTTTSLPAIPICSTQNTQGETFRHRKLTPQITANNLLKTLKNLQNKRDLKRTMIAGVLGYPNVGKSSVINSILSRRSKASSSSSTACPTGPEAGITTSIRKIKLDGGLQLLDSPGVILSQKKKNKRHTADEEAQLILRNVIPSSKILDPLPTITYLLKQFSANQNVYEKLQKMYDLSSLTPPNSYLHPEESSISGTNEFLVSVARKRGRIRKGGIPDVVSAARAVLDDFYTGRLQWWTEPPQDFSKTMNENKDVEVVGQLAEEFKIDEFDDPDDKMV